MEFICYARCSTCKKAQAFLDAHNITYRWRDIKAQNPTKEELEEYWKKSGLPLKRFFNTSGMAYREGRLAEKLPGMEESRQLELLASDGMLVKRPLLVGQNFVLVGFREEEWKEALL